jgi:hypothetical protein
MFSYRREGDSLVMQWLFNAAWDLTRRRSARIALAIVVLVIVWVG